MSLYDRIRRGLVSSSKLRIRGAPETNLAAGQNYSFTPTVKGGRKPYAFAIQGDLPPGFNFDVNTGALTGAS